MQSVNGCIEDILVPQGSATREQVKALLNAAGEAEGSDFSPLFLLERMGERRRCMAVG